MATKTTTARRTPGSRVRFLRDGLGASLRTELARTTGEVYGIGDVGRVAFGHPNPKLAKEGWVYIEVDSKAEPGAKRFVGVSPEWVGDSLTATPTKDPR